MWSAAVTAITASNHIKTLHENAKQGRTAVSLQWLKTFALDSCDDTMTTLDVVEKVVIPATLDLECRYIDTLNPSLVSSPTCFVSHRWGANFRELVKVLLQHFADQEDKDIHNSTCNPFVWLDIFAILQHPTKEQSSDLANLQNVIAQSSHTLLVLDDTGQVLRRVWCLFEIWKTVSHKSVSGLVVLARDVNLLGLRKIFTELNVAEAEATVDADRVKILADIESSIGIEAMNGAIRSALVQSTMLEVARMMPRREEKKHAYFRCIGKASQMCALAGLYADAQPLMIEALELSKELVGEAHELTASSYNNMAGLYRYQGKFSRAEPHQRRAVEISEAITGSSARTRIYLGNLGQLLQNLGRLSEAETFLKRALSIPQAIAGDLSTPHLLNSLASLYMDLGRPADALPLYKKALDSVSLVLSQSDPEIAVYIANLAGVHVELKEYNDAERLQRKAVEICERALGRDHPTTAGCLNNLAEMLAQQKKLTEAHDLANEAYSIRLKLLGETHNSTANSLNNLAGILVELKRYEDAEPLMRKSLHLALNRSDSEKGRENTEDSVTASRMHNLARLLDLNADPTHARETADLYTKALAIREKLLGIDHVETTATASSLASFYSRSSSIPACLDRASQLYQRVVDSYKRQGASSSPRLLNALNHWAMVHHKNGRHEDAVRTAEQAISLASDLKGPSSPEVEAFKRMKEALLTHVRAAAARKQEENRAALDAEVASGPTPVTSVPPQLRGEASSFSPFFSSSSTNQPRALHHNRDVNQMEASLRGHLSPKDQGLSENEDESEDEDEDIWPSAAALEAHNQASLPPLSLVPQLRLASSSTLLSPNSHTSAPSHNFLSPSSSRPSPSTPLSGTNLSVTASRQAHHPHSPHSPRPPSTPSSPLVPSASSNPMMSILALHGSSPSGHSNNVDLLHDGDRSSAPVSIMGERHKSKTKTPDPPPSIPSLQGGSSSARNSLPTWMPHPAALPKIERSGVLPHASENESKMGSKSKARPSSLPKQRFDRRSTPLEPQMKPSIITSSVLPLNNGQRLSALVSPPRPDRNGHVGGEVKGHQGSPSNSPGLSRESSQTKLPTTRRPSKAEMMMKAKLQAMELNS